MQFEYLCALINNTYFHGNKNITGNKEYTNIIIK